MSEVVPSKSSTAELPQAAIGRRRRISLIWAIPFVTLLIAGWLAWDTLSKRGPTIKITLDSAEGLVAGQSHIEHRGIDLGLVSDVSLAKGANGVIVTVEMKKEAEPLLTTGAKTWVVQPRLFAGSLSGLSTLLSGTYLELLPGAEKGAPVRSFVGLEDPPVLQTEIPGQTFLLTANRIGSVSVGSPIFYRDISVGEVLGWDVGHLAKDVTIHAFVRAPYDQYVRQDSRFWNASGVAINLGAQGVQLQMESMKALLLGGVAFETPDLTAGAPKTAVTGTFPLFDNHEAAINAGFHRRVEVVSYFQGAVDGLAPGSLVTFQGLRVGQVTSVDLTYDPKLDAIVAPVHYLIEPERVANINVVEHRGPLENARLLVQRGMRAQLKTTNYLTGQMAVSLDMMTDPPPAELRVEGGVIIMPSTPGELTGITGSVNQLLSKINSMPFAQIGKDLADTLNGTSKITNDPQLVQAIASLQDVVASVQVLLKQLDAGATPTLRQLPAITRNLDATLAQAAHTLDSLNKGYGDNSKFRSDMDRTMVSLNDTIRSIRVLADLLARHPEALVQGRTDSGKE